ncbi:MAG: MFS transporter [Myxococcales bacterium]|nr:MFS transporter [Myxococcales bacterium]
MSAVLLGTAHGYPALMLAALCAGGGNAVFHPADYTLLNNRVAPARLGHAFSTHGLSGNVGWAASPVFITGISALAGWRTAAVSASAIAVLAIVAVAIFLREARVESARHEEAPVSPFAFLQVGSIWLSFLFFLALTLGFGALQNFAPSVLTSLYGIPLTGAASALSIYLLAGAAGIVAGGFLAAKYDAQERAIALLLTAAAGLSFLVATAVLPGLFVAPLMGAIGFGVGTSQPSRDLLVRKVAIARFGKSSFGRIYGFVYSGLDAGLAIAPVLFGRLMDKGLFAGVLFGVAACQLLSVLFALGVGQKRAAARSEA